MSEIEKRLLEAAQATDAGLKALSPITHVDDIAAAKSSAEPVFTIVGRDEFAGKVIRYWADLAEVAGVNPDKIARARQCASDADEWPEKKIPD